MTDLMTGLQLHATDRGVLKTVEQKPIPQPEPGWVLIEIWGCGRCGSDLHIEEGHPDFALKPGQKFFSGHEALAKVHKLGEGVNSFRVGQRVVPMVVKGCGTCEDCKAGQPDHYCKSTEGLKLGFRQDGFNAEYCCLPASMLVPVLDQLSDEEAVLTECCSMGVRGVEVGDIRAGQKVLVIGNGPIGIFTGLLARMRGADVWFVISPRNQVRKDVVRDLDFNYIKWQGGADLGRELRKPGFHPDVYIECSGSQDVYAERDAFLRPGTLWVEVGMNSGELHEERPNAKRRQQVDRRGVFACEAPHFRSAMQSLLAIGRVLPDNFTAYRELSRGPEAIEECNSRALCKLVLRPE